MVVQRVDAVDAPDVTIAAASASRDLIRPAVPVHPATGFVRSRMRLRCTTALVSSSAAAPRDTSSSSVFANDLQDSPSGATTTECDESPFGGRRVGFLVLLFDDMG